MIQSGVLNQKQMWELILGDSKRLHGYCNTEEGPEASSIDLPLGKYYYELPASCRPKKDQSVRSLIDELKVPCKELIANTVLCPDYIYLIHVPWKLDLPQNLRARATAKSSIGRLDVLVRLVTDGGEEYDRIAPGRSTELFVEVIPLTFKIVVEPGRSLSQLRFIRGDEEHFIVRPRKLRYLDEPVLIYRNRDPVDLDNLVHQEGVVLTLDLTPDDTYIAERHVVGFCAKESVDEPIKLWKKNGYDPRAFWDPVYAEGDPPGRVEIKENRFYIFRSKERFQMPNNLAVECLAYSESLGDIRIHYAGFAHPFFGQGREKRDGAPLIFEVRGFSFNTYLWEGAPLARVNFWRMAEPAPTGDMSYSEQELTLSRCFDEKLTDWTSHE